MPLIFVLLPLIRRLRMVTTPDFFDLRYGKGLASFFSVSCLLNVAIATGTILIGMGQVVEGVTDKGIPAKYAIIATAIVGLGYSAAGGLIAAALTDVLQGLLIIVLSFMLVPPMWHAVGGLAGLHAVIPIEKFSLAMPSGAGADSAKTIGLFAIFMLTINGLLGNLVEGTVQAHQAAKNERSLQFGNLFGAMLKRTCTIGWALVGLFSIAVWPNLENPELCFGMAARKFLPPGFSGLMVASLFAAALGCVSAMQVIASAIFTRNIYSKYFVQNKSDQHYLFVARLGGLAIVIAGLITAMFFSNVTKSVEFFWKISAMVGPSMLLGLFFRRGNSWGAWASIVVSATTWMFAQFMLAPQAVDSIFYSLSQSVVSSMPAFLHAGTAQWNTVWYQASLYIPAGVAAYFIVSLLTKPEEESRLCRFYARLNTPVGQEQLLIDSGLEPNPEEIMPHKSQTKEKEAVAATK
jgi:Na+/proline symporter